MSKETVCAGDPVSYAIRGINEISGSTKTSSSRLDKAVEVVYDVDVSRDTAGIFRRIDQATDAEQLIRAVESLGLEEYDGLTAAIPRDQLSGVIDDVENPGLTELMRVLDQKLEDSLCDRASSPSDTASKANRETVYVPELINSSSDGTVYMAKTISSTKKVMMAWDLHEDNEVVVVDNYEIWENLLGWEKLKTLPHGKNKIIEEYSHKLSDEVLDQVIGGSDSTSADSSDDSDSSGRRTRTKPSEEVLNVATGRKHKYRSRYSAKEIAESFDDDETFDAGFNRGVDMLVLFPSTADRNMTDHWWVPGANHNNNYCGIANCNKGTFEYLNRFDNVWHIDDYIDQAADYEFETHAGPMTMRLASKENLVIHYMSESMYKYISRDVIMSNMPEAITSFVEDNIRFTPPLPPADKLVYAPITKEDMFWMRPEIVSSLASDDGPTILYADIEPRGIPKKHSVSSDYKLYARARLPNWDFDSEEMSVLDDASFYLKLRKGGASLVETLGKLHDAGEKPFTESPQSRWSDV
jgi:hypothetical protein